jgi:hypothetical protein
MHHVVPNKKSNWRTHINYKVNKDVTIRTRVEICWYKPFLSNKETGFISFFDFLYKPMMKRYSFIFRFQYFETDGYDSRLYSYENDVMYSYSVPISSGKGMRYYLNINYDLSKTISIWLRVAQSVYRDVTLVGSGLDEIAGNSKTEVKLQGRIFF